MLIENSLHWGLALVPVLLLLTLFVSFDAFKLMSLKELLLLLLFGGFAAVASYPVSGRLIDTLPIGFSNYSRFVAPWLEEAIKGAVVVALFRLNKIGFKLDAVLSGFAIGAGFSVIENIIYLIRLPDYGVGTWLVRGVGTAVMHGITLAILAATAHELSERETREVASDFNFNLLWFVPGYLAAVALHTAFNQLPDRPLLAMLGASMFAPIAILAIFQFGTSEAQKWLVMEHRQHQAELDALTAGRWPDGAAGARVAALAARAGEQVSDRMRQYWQTLAYLVVEAEAALLEEVEGTARFDRTKIEQAFGELERLKTSLGCATYAALNQVLPFSRNDYWEVRELKERLERTK